MTERGMGTVTGAGGRNHESEIQAVEREMHELRRNVEARGGAVVASARALTDWRHHVQAHPWILLGAAAVAGYLLVPRRSRGSRTGAGPEAGSGTEPAAQAAASPEAAGDSFASVVTRMLRDALLRTGVAFFEKELNRQLTDYVSQRRQQDRSHDPIR